MCEPPFENATPGRLLACRGRGRLLVLRKDVCLMAAHARLALHERIRLQLRHLIGMAVLAGADRRYAREVLRCRLAMAHSAVDTIGAMWAGFPLLSDHLMAGGTGVPGGNQPMENMRGLILLSHDRLDGGGQKEKTEQGGTENTRDETIHGQSLQSTRSQYRTGGVCQSVMQVTPPTEM